MEFYLPKTMDFYLPKTMEFSLPFTKTYSGDLHPGKGQNTVQFFKALLIK